jgi:hypothetical protein
VVQRDDALGDGLEEDAVDAVGSLEREELLFALRRRDDERVDGTAADGLERLLGLLQPEGQLFELEEQFRLALPSRRYRLPPR